MLNELKNDKTLYRSEKLLGKEFIESFNQKVVSPLMSKYYTSKKSKNNNTNYDINDIKYIKS